MSLLILNYHRITDYPENKFEVTPNTFEEHLKILRDANSEVISLDRLLGIINKPGELDKNYVAITFDDGNESDINVAAPLLRKYNLTATFFLWTQRIIKEDRWNEYKVLLDEGFEIGSHSKNHVDLRKLLPEELERELSVSRQDLEENLGTSIDHLAAPFGQVSKNVLKATHNVGYKTISTTNFWPDFSFYNSLVVLPRINVKKTMGKNKVEALANFNSLTVFNYATFNWIKKYLKKRSL